jgi:phospholipid/cholesterol/gamma-HCH transport system substrate-binding protein
METKANYVLIGLFAVSVIVAVFAFVFWFHNISGTAKRSVYMVRFDRSASGLRPGSAVLFNGIRMGEVTKLTLNPADPHQVLATIEVDVKAPVRADTAVGLDFQGLTGIASVALTGGSPTAPMLVSGEGEPPMLVADASASQDVTRAAREVLQRIDNLLAENGTLNNTFKSAESTAKSVEIFSATLARNATRIDNILAGLENLSGGADGKGDIQEAARSIRQLADNLDKRTTEISAGINRFSTAGARELEAFATEGRRTLSEIDRAVKNLDRNPSRLLFGGSGNSVPAYNGGR